MRWLGLVDSNTEEDVENTTLQKEVGGHRNIGRPRLRWSDVLRKHIKETEVI